MPDRLLSGKPAAWAVPVRIGVKPDGAMEQCSVEASSGAADLDKLTCKLVLRKAKFRPAVSADGQPAQGVYRVAILWLVANAPFDTSKLSSPDLDITVQRLPTGVSSPALVSVAFEVHADQRQSACAAFNYRGPTHVQNHPALVKIACKQVRQKYRATPAVDGGGKQIPSIRNATVRFSVPPPK